MGFAASRKTSFHDRTIGWVLLPAAKQAFVTGLLDGFCCQQQNKLSSWLLDWLCSSSSKKQAFDLGTRWGFLQQQKLGEE
jgi:hypothetical protein